MECLLVSDGTTLAPDLTGRRLLTPAQVSELVGLAPQTLARLRCERSDFLPFIRIGRTVRYFESDVIAFLDGLARRRSTADGGA